MQPALNIATTWKKLHKTQKIGIATRKLHQINLEVEKYSIVFHFYCEIIMGIIGKYLINRQRNEASEILMPVLRLFFYSVEKFQERKDRTPEITNGFDEILFVYGTFIGDYFSALNKDGALSADSRRRLEFIISEFGRNSVEFKPYGLANVMNDAIWSIQIDERLIQIREILIENGVDPDLAAGTLYRSNDVHSLKEGFARVMAVNSMKSAASSSIAK